MMADDTRQEKLDEYWARQQKVDELMLKNASSHEWELVVFSWEHNYRRWVCKNCTLSQYFSGAQISPKSSSYSCDEFLLKSVHDE